jgi:hypothetical protein
VSVHGLNGINIILNVRYFQYQKLVKYGENLRCSITAFWEITKLFWELTMTIENELLTSEHKLEMCLEHNDFCCIQLWGCKKALTYSSNY